MGHKSISVILSTFEGVLVPVKHNVLDNKILRTKAKFSLALIHTLILL